MNPKRIAIVGLGLIGGSIAECLQKHVPDVERVGIDFPETLVRARRRGMIDRGHGPSDLAESLSDVDLVFLATPVDNIIDLLPDVLSAVRPGTVVTDTGSVKGPILDVVNGIVDPPPHFIGGHPMAGSEYSGIGFADFRILEGARFATVPCNHTPPEIVDGFETFLHEIGFRPMRMTAAYHDRVVATISHVPHLAAAALLRTAGRAREELTGILQMAGRGFVDTTRIGGCDPELWAGICQANRESILQSLDQLQNELSNARQAIENSEVQSFFEAAYQMSQELDRARNQGDDLPDM